MIEVFVHIVGVVIQLNNWLNFLAHMAGVDLAEYPPVTRFGCDVEENWQCKFRHFICVVCFFWSVFMR